MRSKAQEEPPAGDTPDLSADGHRQRMRERLRSGQDAGVYAEHELLELLLGYAIPRRDTKKLAKKLLARFGPIEAVLATPIGTLMSEKGMTEYRAVLLWLVNLLSRRLLSCPGIVGRKISSPQEAGAYLVSQLDDKKLEFFMVLLVDQQNRVLDCLRMEEGIENRAQVYVKKIVRAALDRHATGVICAHNHPSGTSSFSRADMNLTQTIKEALAPLEIRLLDHLLISGGSCLSMVAEGVEPFCDGVA